MTIEDFNELFVDAGFPQFNNCKDLDDVYCAVVFITNYAAAQRARVKRIQDFLLGE